MNVKKGSHIMTDEWPAYRSLSRLGYMHEWVNHKQKYVDGIAYTQNAEALWANIKRGVYGVYRKVSKKYLQTYVDEYTFRYNHRNLKGLMFNALLERVALVTPVAEKLS
jgi:transposase